MKLIRNTNPLNLLGVPAASVPCGFRTEGMPIGLQLAARWWAEGTVLRAAHSYQKATDWHTRRPAQTVAS
jgi:aspartyl-tRNA(Asn)/glutamyl-tRNA(Gln) amidotransferase subunit A